MTGLLVLPFRFGRAAGDLLSRKTRDFYLATARVAFSDTSLAEHVQSGATIPLGLDMVLDATLIFKVIDERLIVIDVPNVVIDLARPHEFVLATHTVIGAVIRAIDADLKRGNSRRFLLLLSTMLPRDDIVLAALSRLIDAGVVRIFADTGDSLGIPHVDHEDAQSHRNRVAAIRVPTLDLFRRKLIRFPGHFAMMTSPIGPTCTSFFFDGKLCRREIVDLIDNFVSVQFETVDDLAVLYDAVVSPWCEAAVLAFCERKALTPSNMSRASGEHDYSHLRQILLILPLVNSGATARKLVADIRASNSTATIMILSILSTRGEEAEAAVLEASDNTAQIPIHYFLKVSQVHYHQSNCPMCHAGIARSDPLDPDPFTRLSSHAFWTIAMDVGFEQERNVPIYRSSIGIVPKLRSLGPENGAFLAYKLEKLLRTTNKLPVDPIIICPMEEGAEVIGDWLEAVFNMTVVRIPKPVLTLSEAQLDRGRILAANQHVGDPTISRWQIQMQTLVEYRERVRDRGPILGHQQSNVIVMDEFSASGTTRGNLIRFVKQFGLDVLCSVSVTDYGGESEPTLSLYSVRLAGLTIAPGARA